MDFLHFQKYAQIQTTKICENQNCNSVSPVLVHGKKFWQNNGMTRNGLIVRDSNTDF
jgi:hypothetical protein